MFKILARGLKDLSWSELHGKLNIPKRISSAYNPYDPNNPLNPYAHPRPRPVLRKSEPLWPVRDKRPLPLKKSD